VPPQARGPWEAIRAAAGDREAGAAEISRRAAEALAVLPRRELEAAARTLVRGHASMAPLWRLATEVLGAGDPGAAAAAFAGRMAAEAEAVAERAAELVPGPLILHSHSGTAVAAATRAGGPALCAVSDPGGEGRLAARRLATAGIAASVVDDAEALRLATDGTPVVVGADAIGPGGVVNKVGTAALAAAGRCLVVAGSSKLLAQDLPAPPPFERTAPAAFAAIVTERGALSAEEAAAAASAFPVHPALRAELGT
jgi:translation initiation factor 2B subunit (eIF-2B alpha/beta/delta family)